MEYVDFKTNSIEKSGVVKPKAGDFFKKLGLTLGVITLCILGLIFVFKKNALSLFDPIAVVANASNIDLKQTDGRINVLLLGLDKRTTSGINTELTDTILVASIGVLEGDTVLISIPRDLWVESPSGYHSKVNAIYANGGTKEMLPVVNTVLGIPIHYYAVVDFNLFIQAIDTLGGIDITVDNAFDDYYYPIEGKETAPIEERYEHIHFNQGPQKMNGTTALKFVRSRKGTNLEGTDFARSQRQQKVLIAIKDKALSLNTLLNPTKLGELYDIYAKNVDTNIDLAAVQGFYLLSQQVKLDKVRSIVLDDRSTADAGGLLYEPDDTELYGGAYVLIPNVGDFSQIHAYVQKYIWGE